MAPLLLTQWPAAAAGGATTGTAACVRIAGAVGNAHRLLLQRTVANGAAAARAAAAATLQWQTAAYCRAPSAALRGNRPAGIAGAAGAAAYMPAATVCGGRIDWVQINACAWCGERAESLAQLAVSGIAARFVPVAAPSPFAFQCHILASAPSWNTGTHCLLLHLEFLLCIRMHVIQHVQPVNNSSDASSTHSVRAMTAAWCIRGLAPGDATPQIARSTNKNST